MLAAVAAVAVVAVEAMAVVVPEATTAAPVFHLAALAEMTNKIETILSVWPQV